MLTAVGLIPSKLSYGAVPEMKSKIILLRISYWVGALADGLATFRMLNPKLAFGFEYRYALGLGAALMLGWTFLLIWADRKPLERKGVLLLTVFPVLTGILMVEIYAVAAGLMTMEEMAPTGSFIMALIVLFSFSYFNAKSV